MGDYWDSFDCQIQCEESFFSEDEDDFSPSSFCRYSPKVEASVLGTDQCEFESLYRH